MVLDSLSPSARLKETSLVNRRGLFRPVPSQGHSWKHFHGKFRLVKGIYPAFYCNWLIYALFTLRIGSGSPGWVPLPLSIPRCQENRCLLGLHFFKKNEKWSFGIHFPPLAMRRPGHLGLCSLLSQTELSFCGEHLNVPPLAQPLEPTWGQSGRKSVPGPSGPSSCLAIGNGRTNLGALGLAVLGSGHQPRHGHLLPAETE